MALLRRAAAFPCCFTLILLFLSSLSSYLPVRPSFPPPALSVLLPAALPPVPLCLPSGLALPPQLSLSPAAYDSSASDELSSNQSMSFSPTNTAQPIPCHGSVQAHSSSGAGRQVSCCETLMCLCVSVLPCKRQQMYFFCSSLSQTDQRSVNVTLTYVCVSVPCFQNVNPKIGRAHV